MADFGVALCEPFLTMEVAREAVFVFGESASALVRMMMRQSVVEGVFPDSGYSHR